jgi:hypothetical protein
MSDFTKIRSAVLELILDVRHVETNRRTFTLHCESAQIWLR